MTARHFIITGAMAAGKSTIAESLARRLRKSVHLRGDIFRRMIVNGAAEMGPVLSEEALAQLRLRQHLAGQAARSYAEAGFSVVYQDILIGPVLAQVAESLADLEPLVVVLNPRPDILIYWRSVMRRVTRGDMAIVFRPMCSLKRWNERHRASVCGSIRPR